MNNEHGKKNLSDLISKAQSPSAKQLSRTNEGVGVITFINSKDNGKRITLSSKVMEELNFPERVQFHFWDKEDQLGVTGIINNEKVNYCVKQKDNKGTIYCAGLVEELTEVFGLDFRKGVSKTFYDMEIVEDEDGKMILIKMI